MPDTSAPVSTTSSAPEFHIGLTMAGAASAGCYTAGVMDYLFEILDLWEKAKSKQLPEEWGNAIYNFVPPHQVVIDVMGGTSAGGMTTIMSAIYALKGKVNPVNDPADKESIKDNIFYDSWVLMGDGRPAGTGADKNKKLLFERTLETSDLKRTGKIESLLNSDFIDSICDDAFSHAPEQNKLPGYFSPGLQVLLSHTMLRSVPLAIDFTSAFGQLRPGKNNPQHHTFDHFTVSHFKLDFDKEKDSGHYLPLDPKGAGAATMKLATKATGAFPIGLRFREFFSNELTAGYMKNMAERIVFDKKNGQLPDGVEPVKWPTDFPDPFRFVGVDGGAVNNEPFGEVLNVLKENKKARGDGYDYALIMIDPFPDIIPTEEYKQPDDLFSVVPAIIGSLWDQAKVKRAETLDAYAGNYFLTEIYPKRYSKEEGKRFEQEDNAIACGACMAFSGFFDIEFRHHDFFLGRDNAKNFFKVYFSFEYDKENNKVHPIHRSWTDDMVKYFKFTRDGKTFLPIVPNMYLLKNKLLGESSNPFEHAVPAWPQYDPAKLFSLKKQMKARVKKMIELAYKKSKTTTEIKEEDKRPETDKWISKKYRTNILMQIGGKIGGAVFKLVFWMMKGKIANRITKAAFTWILKDLEAYKLLKKADNTK